MRPASSASSAPVASSNSSACRATRSARTAAPAARSCSVPTVPRARPCPAALVQRRGERLRAGAHLGEGLVGRVGIVPEHRGPALPQRPRLLVQGGHGEVELRPFRRGAGLLLGLGRHELAGQARRLGLERRDHVDVGRGIERGHDSPPRSRSTPVSPAPLHQSLHAAQGVGQVLFAARRQFRRGGGGLGVELLEGRVQLDLLVTADGQVLHGRQAPCAQVGLLCPGEIPADRQQLGRHAVVRAGRRGLALERPDLAPDLAHQIAQALQVLGRPRQAALGLSGDAGASALPPLPQ